MNTEEFVRNPTAVTQRLVDVAVKLTEKHEKLLKSGIVKKLTSGFKLRMYIEDGYKEYYEYLKQYVVTDASLEFLYEEFERVYDKIVFNNVALAYAYTLGKEILPVYTKEDEKMELLGKFYRREITREEFDVQFGHYAINPYELTSKRFDEYSNNELMKIAQIASKISVGKKKTLDEHMKEKNTVSILIGLREYGKYVALQIVKEIRKELLKKGIINHLSRQ